METTEEKFKSDCEYFSGRKLDKLPKYILTNLFKDITNGKPRKCPLCVDGFVEAIYLLFVIDKNNVLKGGVSCVSCIEDLRKDEVNNIIDTTSPHKFMNLLIKFRTKDTVVRIFSGTTIEVMLFHNPRVYLQNFVRCVNLRYCLNLIKYMRKSKCIICGMRDNSHVLILHSDDVYLCSLVCQMCAMEGNCYTMGEFKDNIKFLWRQGITKVSYDYDRGTLIMKI